MGPSPKTDLRPKIWWSNAIFFVAIHVAAAIGVWHWPPRVVSRASLALCVALWQLADFGITVGYHRLYSHRAYHASFGVRLVLAALGSAAFQGSIKWWCLRHRLHHRFTDDPVHDPYAATRGLFYSHMGWIFYKPIYERLELVDREDLDSDPVPLALSLGFLVPTALGFMWGDVMGAFVWGGWTPVWHCTFMVNSLAHWDGLQPYSDEDTSRGNLVSLLDRVSQGHAFPHDFRSGPSPMDWDPSKWIILALHWLGLAARLRRVREEDLREAAQYMQHKAHHGAFLPESPEKWDGPLWSQEKVEEYVVEGRRCVLLIDGFVLDVSKYLGEHPGGVSLFYKYSIRPRTGSISQGERLLDASWAFGGGLNNHSRAARKRMQELRVARLI
ncbi:hypothetical protein BD779DRAFT_1607641 [Infundibulicybe gibba]|nr:hypothetical protein BD779DRAFT_1607641 [Infundibulicybe gibba]